MTQRISTFQQGFTLIEIIIVFSIIALLAIFGIASFSSYTESQKLRNDTLTLRTILQQARSSALSQVKPSNCGSLQGYEVRICCNGAGSNCPNPACLSTGSYELDAVCSSVPNGILISRGSLTSPVITDPVGTTQRSFTFIPITGGVAKGGVVVLDGVSNTTQTIIVTSTGVIK